MQRGSAGSGFVLDGLSARLRAKFDEIIAPERWQEQLREIVALVESTASGGIPAAPAVLHPPPDQPLGYTLADAAIASLDLVEGYARGALAAGHHINDLLAWALPRADHAIDGDAATAVMSGVLRERGYGPLFEWARSQDDAPAARAVVPPDGIHADLFVVPRRTFLLGKGIARKFASDYPYTRPALKPLRPLGGDRVVFRPELVPALSQEQSFQAMMSQITDQEYEDNILPLSRIPGVNALVFAALLLDEILDPMEILGWIGVDIGNLPRAGTPNRPEDIVPLNSPGTVVGAKPTKYMIFSDAHRDATQDDTFNVKHFSDNKALYLRALNYCDTNGYFVIENGDCEELWYEPTFDPALRQTKLDRFKDIVQRHQTVYQALSNLEADNRYLRSIGNHDSYLWEDPAIVAWRAANPFPAVHGGFIIPGCKPLDELLPHLGLNAGDYTTLTKMLVLHGHHFDFWNCDEHNRLGKFITNALGVPFDALDDIIYAYRGIDRLGHPLIEFWDVLARYSPWNNWPAADVAREWAEAIEYKPLTNNLTQDSIIFSETLAAVYAFLMQSGPIDLFNFGILLCIGHTHNPHSRPWIPYLSAYNPWRKTELFGERVFENLFAIKTRYLNSGTVGWWQDIIWAIEITETAQPRLVYWAEEDMSPVVMDWELEDQGPLPGSPLPALQNWAQQFLFAEAAVRLGQPIVAGGAAGSTISLIGSPGTPATIAGVGSGTAGGRQPPFDISTLQRFLSSVTIGPPLLLPNLPPTSRAGLAAVLAQSVNQRERETLAALALAARQDPVFGGANPRSLPALLAEQVGAPLLQSSIIGRMLWPQLIQGADRSATTGNVDLLALIRALFLSYAPSVDTRAEVKETR